MFLKSYKSLYENKIIAFEEDILNYESVNKEVESVPEKQLKIINYVRYTVDICY